MVFPSSLLERLTFLSSMSVKLTPTGVEMKAVIKKYGHFVKNSLPSKGFEDSLTVNDGIW